MLSIQKLNILEAKKIYNTHMIKDFPKEELKKFQLIENLIKDNMYDALGLYDGEKLIGYAYVLTYNDHDHVLLDYFSIIKEYRSQNYGTRFIKILKEYYNNYEGMMLEVENPEKATNQDDLKIRLRRIKFYENAGLTLMPNIKCNIFSVDFLIYINTTKENIIERTVYKAMQNAYHSFLNDELYNKNVFIHMI